ncbi:MAG TPA: hypothetical protein VJB65_03840, partial [Patescibacteria group bacterium]|nr:hypothetical protein [Patescibacteria group bacterium]
VTANGILTYQFTLAPTQQDAQSGVNPTFSLSHNCSGDLFAVDQAYGVLVKIDKSTGTTQWVGESFSLHDSTGSTALAGLDAVCQR